MMTGNCAGRGRAAGWRRLGLGFTKPQGFLFAVVHFEHGYQLGDLKTSRMRCPMPVSLMSAPAARADE